MKRKRIAVRDKACPPDETKLKPWQKVAFWVARVVAAKGVTEAMHSAYEWIDSQWPS